MNPQPLHGGPSYDRDRDVDEQRHRALQQQDDAAHRKLEQNGRQPHEAYPPSAPHHSSAGSLPIHQPVASRVSGAIHSPGGLLASHGSSAPSTILGVPPVSAAPSFGGPLHGEPGRSMPHAAQPSAHAPHQQMFGPIPHSSVQATSSLNTSSGAASIFGPPLQQESGRAGQVPPYGQSMPPMNPQGPGGPGVAQNQQPILNDALSYLDQVKVQFHEQPDVYNRFLDIMKDFKSQTIDTPGVINRVSELFAGHPNLIQGFNTFLPPGYRIECGLENNPNSIRVTTPSGSTIHSIGGARAAQAENSQSALGVNNAPFSNVRQPGWQQQAPLQHGVESPEAAFSVPATNGAGPYHGPGQPVPFENPNTMAQQRGPAAGQPGPAGGHQQPRDVHTPTPGGSTAGVNGNSSQANMEKRGPVEFNHAISYVNKIKNRFQDRPEIYKQFLEILQTYQREQKPIQDVYSQVTTLFSTAPDLLEDFKQFLPESAAQTRSFGPRAGEDGSGLRAATSTPQPGHSARDGPKMPPVGNFAPPASAGKESKKRPRNEKQPPLPPPSTNDAQASAARVLSGGATSNKRTKVAHKMAAAEATFVEPTLTPYMPEPITPVTALTVTQDQLSFFDRVRKQLNNRLSMTEFLKLLNLYSNDLIDANVLVHKASHFLGANPELMKFFKDTVEANGLDDLIENRPDPPSGRVSLSNCRGYGPSYRLLPKRERLKPCSGRDELCNEVLNDEWASHPTWASEDSGFVAHRKNGYEEGLHRIEEERHDYDFYIEANQKCIQLLEPIAQQMLALAPGDRAGFKLPTGLGGQSTSIYKRVLKKIYGTERGAEVVNEMFANPFAVVPIVMARLRQKDEEWRFTQREWEKVWQAQTESMHLKSLDHMGIQVKSNDKRNLSAKHLVDMIKTRHEEQRRARISKGKEARIPRYQFLYLFDDEDVLLDLLRFMVVFLQTGGQHNASERRRILEFFEMFIPQYFDLPEDKVQEKLGDIEQDSAAEEEEDDSTPAELSNGRARRNGKKSDLLRGVLDPGRNGVKSRGQKEDSAAASASKETTPDLGSANEEEMPDAPDDNAAPDVSNERWLPTIPRPTIASGDSALLGEDGELRADAPFRRTTYNFYCNQNIYVFLSIFHTVYKRLKEVKESGNSVTEELRRERADKPAKLLGLYQGGLGYFDNVAPENYWPRTASLIEEFITGATDENRYQEILRHYYLKNGWTLYTIQDLLKSLCRIGLACNNPDSKGEKTKELVREYLASRQQEDTSYQAEISARKYAEKCIKDGEMFVIGWRPGFKEVTMRWLQKDETTFYMDEMEVRERWQYYISSWVRVEPTEGVPRSKLSKVVLERNLPSGTESAADDAYTAKAIAYDEGMVIGVCLHTSQIMFEKGTTEYFIFNPRRGSAKAGSSSNAAGAAAADGETAPADTEATKAARIDEFRRAGRQARLNKFHEKMVYNSPWMSGVSQDEVMKATRRFQDLIRDGDETATGVQPAAATTAAAEVAT